MEHGVNGITGLKYEALKDFIRWQVPDDHDVDDVLKEYIPILLSLGSFYAHAINSK